MNVVIVDPSKESRLDLHQALVRLGYQVSEFESQVEAWEHIQQYPARIVIADWSLNSRDGIDLCNKVRYGRLSQYTYILIYTDRNRMDDTIRALEAGADGVLSKPLSPKELFGRLEAAKRILKMEDRHIILAGELSSSKARLESVNHLLSIASQRFEALFDGIPIACFTVDKEGYIFEWNRACQDLYGREGHEVLGKKAWDIICPEDGRERLMDLHHKVFHGELIEPYERIDIHKDATRRNVYSQMISLQSHDGSVAGVIIANIDITDRKYMEEQLQREMVRTADYSVQLEIKKAELEAQKFELEEKNLLLNQLAVTDGLTGLMNHRTFQQELEHRVEIFEKEGILFSMILLDVDYFKQFNDTYGHPAGDEVLRKVSKCLREASRPEDLVARYGGEEFAVILPEMHQEEAVATAEHYRRKIEEQKWDLRTVTASFGVATFDSSIKSSSQLIDYADKALYRSKEAGRNCVTHMKQLKESAA